MESYDRPFSSSFQNGVYYLNGKGTFLNSTDYPYYRDEVNNWADRLEKMKALGNEFISFYIPWRHHEIEINGKRFFDFRGETQPNRNVIGLLELCKKFDLKVIIKPGPFIHAELNYGGLPDWVCPSFNPAIEPMLRSSGEPFSWAGIQKKQDNSGMEELPLPAPFDPAFLSEAEHWLKTVTQQVIVPFAGSKGTIVMVQVANEGIYSNYQRAPWAYDFSRSGLNLYAQFLQHTYHDLQEYNLRHDSKWNDWKEIPAPRKWECPASLSGVLMYADWAAYQSYYMREIFSRLRDWIQVDLPFFINANPPTDEPFGIDAWLSRINPDDLPGLQYGFTNWIGVACKDPSVVERYQVMIKRARGANMEENWGFTKIYEKDFAYPSVCLYQTLVQIASGATGYNLYTVVGTRHVDECLDRMHNGDYPDLPPIDGEGKSTPKAATVNCLNQFFNRWGSDFLESEPVRPLAFGLYLPYAHSAVWVEEHDWQKAAVMGIPNHGQTLKVFIGTCLKNHLDFGLPNLQSTEDDQLRNYGTLISASGRWMDSETQEKLRNYVLAGGQLILVGEIPSLDEKFQPVSVLKDVQEKFQVVSLAEFMQWKESEWNDQSAVQAEIICRNEEARQALIWQYRQPAKDVDYLFVFSGKDARHPIELQYRSGEKLHLMKISLPSVSSAVVRIQAGKISAILAKCKNEQLNETVKPYCAVDGDIAESKPTSDWYYSRD